MLFNALHVALDQLQMYFYVPLCAHVIENVLSKYFSVYFFTSLSLFPFSFPLLSIHHVSTFAFLVPGYRHPLPLLCFIHSPTSIPLLLPSSAPLCPLPCTGGRDERHLAPRWWSSPLHG
jgi:hypothetical protein